MPMVYHPNPDTGAMSTGNENTNIAIADTHSREPTQEKRVERNNRREKTRRSSGVSGGKPVPLNDVRWPRSSSCCCCWKVSIHTTTLRCHSDSSSGSKRKVISETLEERRGGGGTAVGHNFFLHMYDRTC